MAEKLGLVDIEEKESAMAETLRIMRILKENGVNLNDIKLQQKINGRAHFTLLSQIKQEGINIEEIIEKNDLDRNFKYGMRVRGLRDAYKGKGTFKITEEEKRIAEKIGLVDEEKIKETLKSTVTNHVSTNQETRAELAKRVKEHTENRENKGEIKDD